MAEKNVSVVKEQLSQLASTDGNFNPIRMWKLKSKILPHPKDPPMAKKDKGGNLVTAPLPLKKLYIETYKSRLAHREMKEEFTNIFNLKLLLWELRYEEIRNNTTEPWTVKYLNKAIKGLTRLGYFNVTTIGLS